MRTKIEKRIGPVPIALVAVLALAAFISAGFWLVPNGTQTAEAQSATCKVDADALEDTLCSVSGDSVELVFENGGNTAETVYATVSGGDRIKEVTVNINPPSAASVYDVEREVGTSFTAHLLEVPAAEDDPNSADDVPGTKSITVSRSMADSDGLVFVITTDDAAAISDLASPALNITNSTTMVVVVFEGTPDADESSVSASGIGAAGVSDGAGGTDDLADGVSRLTVNMKDANGNPLIGWIDLTVEDGADVLFMDSGRENIRVRADKPDGLGDATSGNVMTDVMGLPKSGPVRVKATATMGDLSLDGYIMRTGDPDTVTASTYAPCDPGECEAEDLILKKDEEFFVTAKATDSAGNNVTTIDNNFVMGAIAGAESADRDALDQLSGEDATRLWWNSLGCKAMNTAAEVDSGVGPDEASGKGEDSPFCVAFADLDDTAPADDIYGADDQNVNDSVKDVVLRLVIPDYFAAFETKEAGVFNIEAEARGDKTDTVSVIVSGNASQIMVSCTPVMIPTDTGLTDCSVVVSDANGNPSSNLAKDSDGDITSTARVAVRSREVTLIGDDGSGNVGLNKNGMGTFSILLREDAPEGTSITVNVSAVVGTATLQDSTVVVYGEAGGTPTVPGGELGTVTDVITGFNRGGALQVSWTKAANASGYIIIAINVNDVNNDVIAVVLNDGDLDTQNISGLTPGATYDIYVAATASGGMNTLSEATQVMAK